MTGRILILGASGKIGRHSAHAFKAAGWDVRLYDRARNNLMEAAQSCDVIINGFNPPNYHNWKTIIPEITQQVIAAASVANATVIIPGNVYHFGNQKGLLSEKTLPKPISRKGEIRLAMEREYEASGVQTIILRAGNFIDPMGQDCPMSLVYLRSIKGNKITTPGPVDVRQAMCFLPDWARAAVALAQKRRELDQFEDIPFAGHTLSAQDIKINLEHVLNRKLKFTQFPWWLFTLTAPFWELAREMNEMRYLWNLDHALSDKRLSELLQDFKVTPLDDVFRAMFPT